MLMVQQLTAKRYKTYLRRCLDPRARAQSNYREVVAMAAVSLVSL